MNKNIIRSFLFLLIILINYSAYSGGEIGNTKIDSLRNELKNRKGADKIPVQLDLALLIIGKNIPEAQSLTNSALSAAKTENNKSLEMRAYYMLGRINEVSGNNVLSETYYKSALTIAEASGDNWYKGEILFHKGIIKHNMNEELKALEYFNSSLQACRLSNNFKIMGSSYSMMGTIFRVNGLYDRAIEYIVNSKLYYKKAGFQEGQTWAAYLLGRIYADLKLTEKALGYFQEALAAYTKQAALDGDENGKAICYSQIGILNLDEGHFKEAQKYINYTLKIYTDTKSKFGLSTANKNLGMIEYYMGNYELAEKHLNESLKVKKEVNDFLSFPTIYEYLGLCLISKGQTKEGIDKIEEGLTLAKTNNQKSIQLNIYSNLAKVYLSRNDLVNAISSQKNQIQIQNLLLSGDADIKMEQLQAIFEIDKKNSQIIDLEKQNEINSLIIKQHKISQFIMIIGIFIALIISIIIYWLYNKIKLKNLELKETNAAKDKFFAIIAHDLRGPTGNLASFLEHINDTFDEHSPEELQKILLILYKSAENVSGLLENLLIWAQSQLNKIEFRPAELKLTDVLQTSTKGLMQIAENKQIEIKFELNDQIFVQADPNMVQTIVRNLLNNAIKYTRRGGFVIIRSTVNDMHASVSIEDNGVGIETSALQNIFDISNIIQTKGTENEKSTGLGLILVKDFIERNKGTITIKSQKDKGTIVSFTLPKTQGQ
jgi:signal transduction histidine kinase